MSDPDLFAFGCVVSFLALAGAYVAIRERFAYDSSQAAPTRPAERERTAEPSAAASEARARGRAE